MLVVLSRVLQWVREPEGGSLPRGAFNLNGAVMVFKECPAQIEA